MHRVLTDNGIQFTHRLQDRYTRRHPFQGVCVAHGIEHRLTQVGHRWTNGQAEGMNELLKTATVKRYNYARDEGLKEDLHRFMMAYNHAKRVKGLKGLTRYEYILATGEKEPERFIIHPIHCTVEPDT